MFTDYKKKTNKKKSKKNKYSPQNVYVTLKKNNSFPWHYVFAP